MQGIGLFWIFGVKDYASNTSYFWLSLVIILVCLRLLLSVSLLFNRLTELRQKDEQVQEVRIALFMRAVSVALVETLRSFY
jgi:hypothetical protein